MPRCQTQRAKEGRFAELRRADWLTRNWCNRCLRQHPLRLAKRSLIAADINLPVLYPKPTVEVLTADDLGSKILPFTSRWNVGLLMKISRARIDEPWVRKD
jgi:hypothetical protein